MTEHNHNRLQDRQQAHLLASLGCVNKMSNSLVFDQYRLIDSFMVLLSDVLQTERRRLLKGSLGPIGAKQWLRMCVTCWLRILTSDLAVGWRLVMLCGAFSASCSPLGQQMGLPCLVTQTEKQNHDAASLATKTLGRKLPRPAVEFLA